MTSGANLQLTDHLRLYVTNEKLGHERMIAMLALPNRPLGIELA